MDTERLLRLLKERKVEFVVIGATAFPVHGYARASLDLDLFIRADPSNVQRARDALEAFGYDLTDVSIQDLLTKKLLIRQYALETDLHPFVKGVVFEQVWAKKVRARFGKTYVYFASLDDLITMKQAAGRPKDMEDLRYLKQIKAQLRRRRASRS